MGISTKRHKNLVLEDGLCHSTNGIILRNGRSVLVGGGTHCISYAQQSQRLSRQSVCDRISTRTIDRT